MIVADVSLVVYLLTDSPQRPLAKKLYERDPEWRFPRLWRHEFHNVVVTLTRAQLLGRKQTLVLWRNGIELFGSGETDPDHERAIELALDHNLSGYDAQYVALAEELGVDLWTADSRLIRKLPQHCRDLGNV